jgi:DNA-binding FrmR family transcriptional regulator
MQATACRGALDSFISEVIEDHIRGQIIAQDDRASATKAAEDLIGLIHSYIT